MKIITCEKCEKNYPFSREVANEKQLGDYIQIVINCPYCQHETHCYFTTEKLEKKGKRMQKAIARQHDSPMALAQSRKLENEYQYLFDKLQIEATQFYVATLN